MFVVPFLLLLLLVLWFWVLGAEAGAGPESLLTRSGGEKKSVTFSGVDTVFEY